MTKNHKLIAIIPILIFFSLFIGGKNSKVYTDITVNKVNLQMAKIDKHNVFSSDFGIKYIGHRGVGGLAPENTIPAFELAGSLKFWGAECDVRTTKDGNWMILHDETVDRMTNGTGKIQNLSLSMVQALNVTSGKNIANYSGIKIATLKDYLLTCNKWGLVPVIEMKAADNLQYYDKFIEIVKTYSNIEKVVVISSSASSLKELRKRNTYLTLGLICTDITSSNISFVNTLQNAFIDSSSANITKSEVILCHKNNIKVGAWTVDNIGLANSLIEKGVDYLTTNKLLPEVKKQVASIIK